MIASAPLDHADVALPVALAALLVLAACVWQVGSPPLPASKPPAPAPSWPGMGPPGRLLPAAGAAPWHPALHTSWQWQLESPVDQRVNAAFFDIDLFENDASVVASLHARHRKVACYLSAGSREDWRPDAGRFPAAVIGKAYAGWPGENWLDIRKIELLAPVMRARLDQCRAKGFDAVEPDNIDGYTNDTGFPLSAADQLRYNRWLADEAHARGLSIGLKNDADQADELLPYFDWALTESCFEEGWCNQVEPFIRANKAVFAAEYTDTGMTLGRFCAQARAMHFNAILKHRRLDARRETCP